MPTPFVSLVGEVFGFLTVEEHLGMDVRRGAMYRVRCACGETRIVRASDLRTRAVRKCGRDCTFKRAPIQKTSRTTIGRRGESTTRFGR